MLIIYLWGDYWTDYEAGESFYTDAVYCAAFQVDEHNKVGNIIYDVDQKQDRIKERLYNAQGKLMANVTYKYLAGVPFPFITDYWNKDAGYELIEAALCREQKNWFYEEQSHFDDFGNFIGYNGSTEKRGRKEYFSYPCVCFYDANGNLKEIREQLLELDIEDGWGGWDESVNYSGQMEFSYHDDGNLGMVNYMRSSYTHGLTDSSGQILYDEKGRMIINKYYITHGGHTNIFLYEEDSQRPWACFYWCSHANSFETIYLFRPVQK